jgi:tetratricopeptide (TPR) repeat protein
MRGGGLASAGGQDGAGTGTEAALSALTERFVSGADVSPDMRAEVCVRAAMIATEMYGRAVAAEDLSAISANARLWQRILAITPVDAPARPGYLWLLAATLRSRFIVGRDAADLDAAVVVGREAIATASDNDLRMPAFLAFLTETLFTRYELTGTAADLDDGVAGIARALAATPSVHPQRARYLTLYGSGLRRRFEQRGDSGDLDTAISACTEAFSAADDSARPGIGTQLAAALARRFRRSGDQADIDAAIGALRDAASSASPSGGIVFASRLSDLANALRERFTYGGAAGDIEEAVAVARQAVAMSPQDHILMPVCLSSLGTALLALAMYRTSLADVEEAAAVLRQVVDLRPSDHPGRAASFSDLSTALRNRFQITGDLADLTAAVDASRQAVDALIEGNPERWRYLLNLCAALGDRYDIADDPADAAAAVEVGHRMIDAMPDDHHERGLALYTLGNAFCARSDGGERTDDLDAAIAAFRQAVASVSDDSPMRAVSRTSLGSMLLVRFTRTKHRADLDEAIATCQQAVREAGDGADGGHSLFKLGLALLTRYEQSRVPGDLASAIAAQRRAVAAAPASRDNLATYQAELGKALQLSFELTGRQSDLAEAVTVSGQAVDTARASDPAQSFYRRDFGAALAAQARQAEPMPLTTRSELAATLADLVDDAKAPNAGTILAPTALADARRLAEMLSEDEEPDLDALALLGRFHWLRWDAGDDSGDPLSEAVRAYLPVFVSGRDVPKRLRELIAVSAINDAVEDAYGRVLVSGDPGLIAEALSLWRHISGSLPEDHADQSTCSGMIGTLLGTRFALARSQSDLDESLTYLQAALETAPADELLLPLFHIALSESLRVKFLTGGDPEDIGRALEEARLSIAGASEKSEADAFHGQLGVSLLDRFELSDDPADLDTAITSLSRAAEGDAAPDLIRGAMLSQLCRALRLKSDLNRDIALLDQAIEFGKEAAGITPAGFPAHAAAICELGTALVRQGELGGRQAGIDAAINLFTNALDETVPGDPGQAVILGGLAMAMQTRAMMTGDRTDLDAAIDAAERAVAIVPAGDPARATFLYTLGSALTVRSEYAGSEADLDAAIVAHRQAVDMATPRSRDRLEYLRGNSLALLQKFDRSGDADHLNESIALARRAVAALPQGSADRGAYLAALGIGLRTRFLLTGDVSAMDEAVTLMRQAVLSAPDSVIRRSWELLQLGTTLWARFGTTGHPADLDDAITTLRQSIATAADLTVQPQTMLALASVLDDTYERTRSSVHRDEAIDLYTNAANSPAVSSATRITAARLGAHLAQSSAPQHAADLLETAVRQVPQAASRQLGRTDQQYALSHFTHLASEACEFRLSVGGPGAAARALGLLELGRAVLQGQALDDRADLLALHVNHPVLANDFLRLRDRLGEPDDPVTTDPGISPPLAGTALLPGTAGPAIAAVRAADRFRVGTEFASLLDRIRSLDGFESFLMPPPAQELTKHANHGPIIVINVGHTRGDALNITTAGIIQVPLPGLTIDIVNEKIRTWEQALTSTFRCPAGTPARASAENTLSGILEWLWDTAAEPALCQLGYVTPPDENLHWPRVWWAPGGQLSMLPLHAAGYHRAGTGATTLDRVISSYTPTVRALAHARERAMSTPPTRTLIVAMPTTPGLKPLVNVRDETARLAEMLPSPTLLIGETSQITDRTPTRTAVIARLPDAGIAHFSCHAASHPDDPSRSQLYLYDHRENPLTVAALMPVRLHHAQLAFLSACQTAHSEAPGMLDEGLHLTSAFQLAGFPHVIGTQWPVYDDIAADIAVAFYHRLGSGPATLNVNMSAQALHDTIREQRDTTSGAEYPSLWAGYVHAGA